MALTWLAADMVTGKIYGYFPEFTVTQGIAVTMCRYESASGVLPAPKVCRDRKPGQDVTNLHRAALADWRTAIREYEAVWIALDESGQPIWGGIVQKSIVGADGTAQLDLVTAEAYFDRCPAGGQYGSAAVTVDPNHPTGASPRPEVDLPQTTIARRVVQDWCTGPAGLPLRVQETVSSVKTFRSYLPTDNNGSSKTVYAALTDLSSKENPIEWTIGWEWVYSTPPRITPVMYIADRLGTAAPAGRLPQAQFTLPGNLLTAQMVGDYSAGMGANSVDAVSSGNPSGVNYAPHVVQTAANLNGRPLITYIYSPSTTPLYVDALTAYARQAVNVMQAGNASLALTAVVDKAPKLGAEWVLGDDIGYSLSGPAWMDGQLRPGMPARGYARVKGWKRAEGAVPTIQPVLAGGDLSS